MTTLNEIYYQEELSSALELLKAALPILIPDAPLRWYKNDKVRDDIRRFLKKHGIDAPKEETNEFDQ